MSVSAVTSLDTTYTTRVDDASPTVTYVGEASVGSSESSAVWRIKRLTTSGTVLSIQWANGNRQFENIWNDRSTLNYV